jgi:hypothetical protein
MKIRVKGLEVRTVMDWAFNRRPPMDLRYDVQVEFSPEDVQNMHVMRGNQTEEMIDLIGEGIKSEMRRLHEKNK